MKQITETRSWQGTENKSRNLTDLNDLLNVYAASGDCKQSKQVKRNPLLLPFKGHLFSKIGIIIIPVVFKIWNI